MNSCETAPNQIGNGRQHPGRPPIRVLFTELIGRYKPLPYLHNQFEINSVYIVRFRTQEWGS